MSPAATGSVARLDSRPIQAVVFDMGGVIVELAPIADLLAGLDLPQLELWDRWIRSRAVRAFESGACDVDEFVDRLIAEIGVELDPADVLARFARFPRGLFPGAAELVTEVRARCVTGILSNTNDLHWQTQPDHQVIRGLFDREYLSYALGLVKPDAAIYDHVIADLGIEPAAILFLDDNQINVDGARAVGMRSELARGPAQARAALQAAGVLD